MKTNKSLPNEGIEDNNVVYHAKTEGYTTMMSYMNELYEIARISGCVYQRSFKKKHPNIASKWRRSL